MDKYMRSGTAKITGSTGGTVIYQGPAKLSIEDDCAYIELDETVAVAQGTVIAKAQCLEAEFSTEMLHKVSRKFSLVEPVLLYRSSAMADFDGRRINIDAEDLLFLPFADARSAIRLVE